MSVRVGLMALIAVVLIGLTFDRLNKENRDGASGTGLAALSGASVTVVSSLSSRRLLEAEAPEVELPPARKASEGLAAGDWKALRFFERTLTRAEFEAALRDVYDPFGRLFDYVKFDRDHMLVFASPEDREAYVDSLRPERLPEEITTEESEGADKSGSEAVADSTPAKAKTDARQPDAGEAVAESTSTASEKPDAAGEQDDAKPVRALVRQKAPKPIFAIEFASEEARRSVSPRRFRTPTEFRSIPKPSGKPLHGLRVVIDPGHIGGKYGRMEQRRWQHRGRGYIQEGDLALEVSRILRRQLEVLGATVYMVRTEAEPVTPYRPADFVESARRQMVERSPRLQKRFEGKSKEEQIRLLGRRLRELSERLFYRSSEIYQRSLKIKKEFEPDITLSVHFNATGNSGRGGLARSNRNVFFVLGAFTKGEVDDPAQRQRMVYKILEKSSPVETEVAVEVAEAFRRRTGYETVMYGDSKVSRQVIDGYFDVVGRNLAALRYYDGPVILLEPYFMNNIKTYQRLLHGDYEGSEQVAGAVRHSIYHEYASAVAEGVLRAYHGFEPFGESTPEEMMQPPAL